MTLVTLTKYDIEEQIAELEDDLEYGCENCAGTGIDPDVLAEEDIEDDCPECNGEGVLTDDGVAEEIRQLRDALEDFTNASDDGEDFRAIREDTFEDYAREVASDIHGEIEGWPWSYINWSAAADGLKMDYTSVSYGGHDWLLR